MEMYERALKVDPRDQESLKARKNLAFFHYIAPLHLNVCHLASR